MNLKYYCPKCNSENIEVVCLNPPIPISLSLDNAGKNNMKFTNALYTTTKYKGICKDCGYTKEWSE